MTRPLPEFETIPADAFGDAVARLAWSLNALARRLQVKPGGPKDWKSGRRRVPPSVGPWLQRIENAVAAVGLPDGWPASRKLATDDPRAAMTAEEFAALVKQVGWSLAELARRLDEPLGGTKDWASGRRRVPPVIAIWLRRLAAVLDAIGLPDNWRCGGPPEGYCSRTQDDPGQEAEGERG